MAVVVGEPISMEHFEELVERHMAFLIRTVSGLSGKYVSIGHDDDFSIALSAFAEAVERYQPERGNFLSFAGLVIQSRLKTHWKEESRHFGEVSLEALSEAGQEPAAPDSESQEDLQDEIQLFQQELAIFGLTLEGLADESPKHQDTRTRAVDIAERSSQDQPIVTKTYQKRKLPVREVSRLCAVTEKIVKGSKHFILATMLVFVKRLPILIHWIKGAR